MRIMHSLSSMLSAGNFLPKLTNKAYDDGKPLVLLGITYSENEKENVILDFRTQFHFTYRKGFTGIQWGIKGECVCTLKDYMKFLAEGNGSALSSDQGFGCICRTTQSMMAQVLSRIHLGRNWRRGRRKEKVICDDGLSYWIATGDSVNIPDVYFVIIQKFFDSVDQPYSIHRILIKGAVKYGVKLGHWFAPTIMCNIMKELVSEAEENLIVHVCLDRIIFINDLIKECKEADKEESKKPWVPLLLLIPIKLGISKFNLVYKNTLKKFFRCMYNCGMVGGKPRSSLYFVGYQDDDLLYFDPHIVQKVSLEPETYHSTTMYSIPIAKIDPSLAFSFLLRTEEELLDLKEYLNENQLSCGPTPIVSIFDTDKSIKKNAIITNNSDDNDWTLID